MSTPARTWVEARKAGQSLEAWLQENEQRVAANLMADPEISAVIKANGSGTFQRPGGQTIQVRNGEVSIKGESQSKWMPVAKAAIYAAAIGVTAGFAAPYLAGGATVSTAGGVGIGETASTVGPAAITGFGGAAATTAGVGAGTSLALRYGLPIAGQVAGGLIQAHAEGKASDAQQKYLEEALAYQKEKDQYDRTTEASRYSSYQGRIAPFIANGTSSNDRMAALLGLPARSGGSSGGGPSPSQGVAQDPATAAAIDAALKGSNSNDDAAYWRTQIAAHGDSSAKNWDYWKHRIDIGDGVGKGYAGATTAAPPSSVASAASPAAGAMVQMRAPDGSSKSVKQSDVQHYLSLGAVLA